jgi:RarD protein
MQAAWAAFVDLLRKIGYTGPIYNLGGIPMKHLKSPRVMIVLAMVAFGTLGPFVRNIAVSSGELALYRAVMAAMLLAGYLCLTKHTLNLRALRKELPLLLLSGMAMGINWILLFEAYKYTTVSVATLSYYFAPVLVTLVCPLLFGEKMGLKQWLCSGMSTLGIVLITGVGDLSGGSSHLTGILFGLGAAVFYATVILLNKFIKGVAGIQRTFLQFLAAIVILVPYVAFSGGVTLQKLDGLGWGCLLIVGLIHTGVTYCLYFSALKELPGQEAAILSYIDPLVAVLISVFVLGEQMTLVQIIGGALILGFTLWNEIQPKQ